MKVILISLFSLFFILIAACNENEIIVVKACTEPPEFSSYDIKLIVETDTIVEKRFQLNHTGYFLCQNTPVRNGNYLKNVNIYGYICKDLSAEVFIDYNDSLTTSKIKATLRKTSSFYINGEVWYCSNENNMCNYSEIGFVIIAISNKFEGAFVTPLLNGTFEAFLLGGNIDSHDN